MDERRRLGDGPDERKEGCPDRPTARIAGRRPIELDDERLVGVDEGAADRQRAGCGRSLDMREQMEVGLFCDPAGPSGDRRQGRDGGEPGPSVADADATLIGVPAPWGLALGRNRLGSRGYVSRVAAPARTACAAASRATGTRNGEHDT